MKLQLRFGRMLLFLGALVISNFVFSQGSTTASMNGRITDSDGEPLIGANVLAIHQKSGTTYGNSTDLDGFYRIPGMRVGGPYKVTISYTGYEEFSREGIYLELGQSLNLSAELSEASLQLESIEVVANRSDQFDGNRTGQETIIDENDINSMPTTTRSLADFARLNPLARIDEGSDGFSISIAGQNNRYNAIYIDGIVNNDVFGLAASGTNGGQTGAPPVSIDAIEQFQVAVAPFDVRQSGFAGGSVNAVTRSGTNNFEGSAYWFFRNENLVGLDPLRPDYDPWKEDREATDPDLPTSRSDYKDEFRLDEFTAQTAGFRVGGPLVKNKLFFFVNGEFQRDRTPLPFTTFEEDYRGDADRGDINNLINKLNGFGYDPGTFENNQASLDRNFVLAKIDYNLNQNHKFSLRYSWNDIENLEARSSSPNNIRFENGSEFFPSVTHTAGFEWNALLGSSFSNNLKIGYTRVRDDRNGSGQPFPNVRIRDGQGNIEFGTERFSTANRLDQDIVTLTDDFQIFKNRHTITIGTHNEFYSVGNLFIRENFGAYQYDSLSQFLNDIPARQYDRSFSQVDNVAGDESEAIASFSGFQFGLYVQDDWQVSDDFKLTIGVRADLPFFPDAVPTNTGFNQSTIPALRSALQNTGYTFSQGTVEYFGEDPLLGAQTGQFIDLQVLFSPRLGFNWDVGGKKNTQIRGGAGIFTSRIPLVWFGGAYNNYGLNIGGTRLRNRVVFRPDVNNQPIGEDDMGNLLFPADKDLDNPTPSGQVDLFDENFKLPQVFKANLAVDQKLPLGLIGTVELLYTKYINNIRYQSLNFNAPTEGLEGTPDDRPIFNVFNEIDDTYTGIFLATNTNKGYAYNVVASLTKPLTKGFTATVSYTWGDSYTINDGTSSQNNSQWRGYKNVGGLNAEGEVQRSTFAGLHRVLVSASYRKEYLGFLGTQISIFYNGSTGNLYSYTYNEAGFGGMVNDGAFNNNNLLYVPRDANEINLVDANIGGTDYTAAEQWALLDEWISRYPELDENRGSYVERNIGRVPFVNTLDLRFLQDFFITTGKTRHTLQFTMDIFNFAALFSKDAGRIFRAGSFGNVTPLEFEDFQSGTNIPTFSVSRDVVEGRDPWEGNIINTGRIRSSRWSMQVGLRYIFR